MSRQGDGLPGAHTFDWQGYIEATTRSHKDRIERQLEAKRIQVQRRRDMYEDATADLKTELREVSRELELLTRTHEDRPRLEKRRDRLQQELVEVRERFHEELRELEDAILELEAELEEVCEAEELLAEVLD